MDQGGYILSSLALMENYFSFPLLYQSRDTALVQGRLSCHHHYGCDPSLVLTSTLAVTCFLFSDDISVLESTKLNKGIL